MAEHHSRHPSHSVVVALHDGHTYCYDCSSFILLLRPVLPAAESRKTTSSGSQTPPRKDVKVVKTATVYTQTPQRKAAKKTPLKPWRGKKYVAKKAVQEANPLPASEPPLQHHQEPPAPELATTLPPLPPLPGPPLLRTLAIKTRMEEVEAETGAIGVMVSTRLSLDFAAFLHAFFPGESAHIEALQLLM
jgi:hypothetical protein